MCISSGVVVTSSGVCFMLSFFFCSLKLLRHPSIQDGGQQQMKCPVPQNSTKRASYALFQIFLIVLLNQSD